MRKFEWNSKKFKGTITLIYGDNGIIRSFYSCDAEFDNAEKRLDIIKRIPLELKVVLQYPDSFKEVKEEITFELFWSRYFKNRQKDNSSKKKSEIKWGKMSSSQQRAACNYIGKYMANIPAGTMPKLAETYLNSEVWEG